MSRREFLAAASAVPLLAACSNSGPRDGRLPDAASGLFRHGVASGDPLSDRIILWTRVTPAANEPISLSWRLCEDPELSRVVASGRTMADAGRDYTVKVDATGLAAGTTYYYAFSSDDFTSANARSPIGRTHTLPAAGVQHLRFAVCSCSSYGHGYFNVYREMARRADLDAVIHLGDYIYESSGPDVRLHAPDNETTTLQDYRTRHAQYKTDPDLQALHRQNPFIAIWDDHESTDNSARDSARNHTEGEEGVWTQRKAWAQQAYFEWLPIREQRPNDYNFIYRSFDFGGLAELVMLDTRLQRDDAPADFPPPCDPALSDPDRRLLGEAQETWFLGTLRASDARWHIVGSSVMFGQWKVWGAPNGPACGGQYLNADQWDGYQVERQRVMDALRGGAGAPPTGNCVFLAGDIHSAWALDVVDDPNNALVYNPVTGDGSLAVEFVCDSVTSDFPLPEGLGGEAFLAGNPHVKYVQTRLRGYLLLDVRPERVQGEWWYVDTVAEPADGEQFGAAYRTDDGANRLVQALVASEPKANPPPFAP